MPVLLFSFFAARHMTVSPENSFLGKRIKRINRIFYLLNPITYSSENDTQICAD
jgi:hypothetical protein